MNHLRPLFQIHAPIAAWKFAHRRGIDIIEVYRKVNRAQAEQQSRNPKNGSYRRALAALVHEEGDCDPKEDHMDACGRARMSTSCFVSEVVYTIGDALQPESEESGLVGVHGVLEGRHG